MLSSLSGIEKIWTLAGGLRGADRRVDALTGDERGPLPGMEKRLVVVFVKVVVFVFVVVVIFVVLVFVFEVSFVLVVIGKLLHDVVILAFFSK